MGLQRITEPDGEPVDLAEAKDHARVTHDKEDALIEIYLRSARMWAEGFTHRAFISQQWQLTAMRFPISDKEIELPKGRLLSVEQVQYIDNDGATQTLRDLTPSPTIPGDLQIDTSSDEGGRIRPKFDESWPEARSDTFSAVTILFTVGYGTAPQDVPDPIRQAILVMVADAFETRQEIIIGAPVANIKTIDNLLNPYRILRF